MNPDEAQMNDNSKRWKLRECLTVPGQPVGKGRPRFTRAGKTVRTYTPKTTRDYEAKVAWLCAMNPTEKPVRMEITAIFRRPLALSRKKDPENLIYHDKKPDLDNVCKSVIDGCSGRAFKDDGQVCSIDAEAYYSEKGGKPRTEIAIYELRPTTNQREEDEADMAPSTEGSDTSSSGRAVDKASTST